jgi:hypothetical protein
VGSLLLSWSNLGLLPRCLCTRSVSLLLKKKFSFHIITWVCFDILTQNLLCGSLRLPTIYLRARSRSFAYNRIFSFSRKLQSTLTYWLLSHQNLVIEILVLSHCGSSCHLFLSFPECCNYNDEYVCISGCF